MAAIPAIQKLTHMHPSGLVSEIFDVPQQVATVDIAAEVASAYESGLREGRLAVQQEYSLKEQLMEASHRQEIRRLIDEDVPKLAAGFDAGIASMQKGLCSIIVDLLRPVLTRFMTAEILKAVEIELRGAIEDASSPAILVQGPPAILERLRREFAERDRNVTFEATSATEVRLTIDQRLVETRLGEWTRLLHGGA